MAEEPQYFAGAQLNRLAAAGDAKPSEATFFEDHRGDALFVVLKGNAPLLKDGQLEYVPFSALDALTLDPVFLGLSERHGGVALFAVQLSEEDADGVTVPPGAEYVKDLRRAVLYTGVMARPDVAVLGFALSMFSWHTKALFCGVCGAATGAQDCGGKRVCTACGSTEYPRTDAVVIQLVVRGDRCLLGKINLPGRSFYSCLAGFLSPGESLEEAVRRETYEETGVRVGAVRYVASQPWPMGRTGAFGQLMVAFIGEATTEELKVNTDEVAEARWWTKAEVAEAIAASTSGTRDPDRELNIPGPVAIAHTLMAKWVAEPPTPAL